MSWYEELEKKYIHLFECENDIPLRGIEVEEGWSKLTEELLRKFEWIRTHNLYYENPDFDSSKEHALDNRAFIEGPPHEIKIFQIKQKFGIFECYVKTNSLNDMAIIQVYEAIAFIKGKASLTCENCGKVGEHIPTKGWINILCNECKKED